MDKENENTSEIKNEDETVNDESNSKDEQQVELSQEDKLREIEDKLTRSYAELENQRRRYEKEKDDAFEYGGFAFARETLNLLDNLDRSRISLENDEKLKNSDAVKKIFEHLDIIKKDTISIFEKNNIKPIESLNKKLDPNFHQAMIEIEDNTKEPGTIIQEIQKGFTIKDRLLRPSLVGVSKKVSKKEEKTKENKENIEDK